MKKKTKFAKIAKLEKRRSNTAQPEFDEDGDWSIVIKTYHKFVKIPVAYYHELERDSKALHAFGEALKSE